MLEPDTGVSLPAVDFALSAEQEGLRDAVTSTLRAEAPMSYVRRMIDDERGFTDELWAKLADLGWLGLLVPEAHGGLGLGLVDLVVVQEEMGKALFPGPYLSSAVMATSAAVALGATDLLPALATGEARGTLAVEELGQGDPLGDLTTTATPSGDGWGRAPASLTAVCGMRAGAWTVTRIRRRWPWHANSGAA